MDHEYPSDRPDPIETGDTPEWHDSGVHDGVTADDGEGVEDLPDDLGPEVPEVPPAAADVEQHTETDPMRQERVADAASAVGPVAGRETIEQPEQPLPAQDEAATETQPDRPQDVVFPKIEPRPNEPGEEHGMATGHETTVAIQRDLKRKLFHAKAYLHEGSEPASARGQRQLANVKKLEENDARIAARDSVAATEARQHLRAGREPDRFSIQERSKAIAADILEGTESLDMVDGLLAMRAADHVIYDSLDQAGAATEEGMNRRVELRNAVHDEIIHAIDPAKLVGDHVVNLPALHKEVFGEGELTPSQRHDIERIGMMVHDKLIISELVLEGGLWTMPPDRGGAGPSSYAREPRPEELRNLNNQAAETIEGLHLLKSYGVTPFEVTGQQLDLPWDIAVMPPIEMGTSPSDAGIARYADGAIADFVIMPPNPERTGLDLTLGAKGGNTEISIGDAPVYARFRLHDNGQISYGLVYKNVPSDHAQEAFEELQAGPAFERLRGLFISLAFDAVVPDDVVRGRDVQGSVATTLRERPEDPGGARVGELLLRRRRALRNAHVDRDHRTPEGWSGPTRTVEGYVRRVPEGCSPRATAEQEARQWHADRHLPFNGLPEGYTWVGDYQRRANNDVTYRRARFRRDATTTAYLRDIRRRGDRR